MSILEVRRLALARAGLLRPEWTGFTRNGRGSGKRAIAGALAVIRRFGYLQLDTVSIAGARSHTIVLLSRLMDFDPALGEQLLRPGIPLFEYWGHEACWIPMELYSAFAYRRKAFRTHPWWGDIISQHPELVRKLRKRIRKDGPLRSINMEGKGSSGWWNLKTMKRVATALWSSGELAIRERKNFQRSYDLAQRVIPDTYRKQSLTKKLGMQKLLLKALDGHGWASTTTLASTWRMSNRNKEVTTALEPLAREGQIVACALENPEGRPTPGWVRPQDLSLATRLKKTAIQRNEAVLLSPFDPLLWDRARVRNLFNFDQVLEIFKPAEKRIYGYYCLPVLCGERLIARFDLKADRKNGILRVLSIQIEKNGKSLKKADTYAAQKALARYADALALKISQ